MMRVNLDAALRPHKCIDCGMFAFYRNTNDYREVYGWQRNNIQKEDFVVHEGDMVQFACYLNVYDVQASVGFYGPPGLSHGQKNMWGSMPSLTQRRRCGKFIEYVPGRLPSDLVEEKRQKWNSRMRKATLLLVALTALSTAVTAIMTIIR